MFIIKDELLKEAYLKDLDHFKDYPIYTCNKTNAKKYKTKEEAEMMAIQLKHSKVIDEKES